MAEQVKLLAPVESLANKPKGPNSKAGVEEDNTMDEAEESPSTAEEDNKSSKEEQSEYGDIRFPTANRTRHCYTPYIECIAVKGHGATECQKIAKYYRSLCPGEWVEKWNEQRGNGPFLALYRRTGSEVSQVFRSGLSSFYY